jgi:hypothetical protein
VVYQFVGVADDDVKVAPIFVVAVQVLGREFEVSLAVQNAPQPNEGGQCRINQDPRHAREYLINYPCKKSAQARTNDADSLLVRNIAADKAQYVVSVHILVADGRRPYFMTRSILLQPRVLRVLTARTEPVDIHNH